MIHGYYALSLMISNCNGWPMVKYGSPWQPKEGVRSPMQAEDPELDMADSRLHEERLKLDTAQLSLSHVQTLLFMLLTEREPIPMAWTCTGA